MAKSLILPCDSLESQSLNTPVGDHLILEAISVLCTNQGLCLAFHIPVQLPKTNSKQMQITDATDKQTNQQKANLNVTNRCCAVLDLELLCQAQLFDPAVILFPNHLVTM